MLSARVCKAALAALYRPGLEESPALEAQRSEVRAVYWRALREEADAFHAVRSEDPAYADLLEGFARVLAADAWITECEYAREDGDRDRAVSLYCHANPGNGDLIRDLTCDEILAEISAGQGEDWCDVVPPAALAEARVAAHAWIVAFEDANGCTLEDAWHRVCERDPSADDGGRRSGPDRFGACLACEAVRSGVAWGDDHDDHGFEVPSLEDFTLQIPD